MTIPTAHLRILAAHVSDHLAGRPCPSLPPAEMAGRWQALAQWLAEIEAREKAEASKHEVHQLPGAELHAFTAEHAPKG